MTDGANENDNENEYMKQQLTAIYQQFIFLFSNNDWFQFIKIAG